MSNHLAIATVTATLVHLLRGPVMTDVDNSNVVADRPLEKISQGDTPEVRIFLYGVRPNASWRNCDLPTRRPVGDLAQRPQAALDLYYLFTFQGSERDFEPQRLLGVVERELHARPVLSRELIRQMVERELDDDAQFPLATTDLADQDELVRITPLGLDLDELSKLWSVFFQSPYQLSVAYQASVVLVNPDEAASPALPVQERRIFTTTIRRPRIDRVLPAAGPGVPVTIGTEVLIRGSQLRGEETWVWFGAERVIPPSGAIGDREIRATVPPGARAGLSGVRVEHRTRLEDPGETRHAGESNIAPLVIRPRVRQDGGVYQVSVTGVTETDGRHEGNLEVDVEPAVGRRQRVSVLINRLGAPPEGEPSALAFADEARDAEGEPEEASELVIPFRGVPAGAWLVRLQVDGAESPLDSDPDPAGAGYIAPQVTIP